MSLPSGRELVEANYARMEARIRELTESATRLIVAMRRDSWPGHDHSYVRELGHLVFATASETLAAGDTVSAEEEDANIAREEAAIAQIRSTLRGSKL